jgi:hypothetical protein
MKSKPPCAVCRGKGMTLKSTPTKGWLEVKRCTRCCKFTTDLEAASWYFFEPKVVELFDIVGVVGNEHDKVEGRW